MLITIVSGDLNRQVASAQRGSRAVTIVPNTERFTAVARALCGMCTHRQQSLCRDLLSV